MKPLMVSWFCPNDCDKKEPWQREYVGEWQGESPLTPTAFFFSAQRKQLGDWEDLSGAAVFSSKDDAANYWLGPGVPSGWVYGVSGVDPSVLVGNLLGSIGLRGRIVYEERVCM